MNVPRISILTGELHLREINITPQELALIDAGALTQQVAPHLNPDDREYLINGITPDEANRLLPPDEEA